MGRLYIGDNKFNGLFEAGIAGPVDARYVVENYLDLTNSDTWPSGSTDAYIYEGMQVYVKDEKKVYILTDATNYQSESSWKELASDIEGAFIDIVDNLNSDRSDAALSANMGRQLRDNLEAFKDDLLVDDKIRPEYLPQFNTGLLYGGTIDKDGICVLTTALKEKLGLSGDKTEEDIRNLSINALKDVYFIAKEAGDKISYTGLEVPKRSAGDWIISTGDKWEKISSNAVTSVVGKTGAITRTQLLDELEYKDTDSNPALGGFIRKTEINRVDESIAKLGSSVGGIGARVESVESKLTWKTL